MMADLRSSLGFPPEYQVLFGVVALLALLTGLACALIWSRFITKRKMATYDAEFDSLEGLRKYSSNYSSQYTKEISILRKEVAITQEELDELLVLKNEMRQFAQERKPVYVQLKDEIASMESRLRSLYSDHSEVVELAGNQSEIKKSVDSLAKEHAKLLSIKNTTNQDIKSLTVELSDLRATLDLYTQQMYFVDHGHYQFPEFLYQSSEKYKEEIKRERFNQKQMIKDGSAIENGHLIEALDHPRVVSDQARLVLRSFNIELDLLFGKIKHSNYVRTVNRIDALAKSLEKDITNKNIGISVSYIESKLRECTLIFQEQLIRKEEQEADKLARTEIAEERKAQREYDAALAKAKRDEQTYVNLLNKARVEIHGASVEEVAEQRSRITYLEEKLAEAKAQEERAESLAQQTKCGYIYVISNEGSFGKGVYKIGLTRRLDPLDRVKELGDASVPFPFDIHGIIYSKNAPDLEKNLHQQFSKQRVNVVNLRKEFFRVNLQEIERALNELCDLEVTLSAEPGHNGDYEEARRMRRESLDSRADVVL